VVYIYNILSYYYGDKNQPPGKYGLRMKRISLKRTVLYDENTGHICQCSGDFWKTCSLRVMHDLPCTEAILTITPIVRDEVDPADNAVRSVDEKLSQLTDGLRALETKFKL
jgi:hypothetical protein